MDIYCNSLCRQLSHMHAVYYSTLQSYIYIYIESFTNYWHLSFYVHPRHKAIKVSYLIYVLLRNRYRLYTHDKHVRFAFCPWRTNLRALKNAFYIHGDSFTSKSSLGSCRIFLNWFGFVEKTTYIYHGEAFAP